MLCGFTIMYAVLPDVQPPTHLKTSRTVLERDLSMPSTFRFTGLERIIQRNPSYDVRSLLDGVGGVLSALIDVMGADASYLLGAYKPLPVPAADRSVITELLTDAVRVRYKGLYIIYTMYNIYKQGLV